MRQWLSAYTTQTSWSVKLFLFAVKSFINIIRACLHIFISQSCSFFSYFSGFFKPSTKTATPIFSNSVHIFRLHNSRPSGCVWHQLSSSMLEKLPLLCKQFFYWFSSPSGFSYSVTFASSSKWQYMTILPPLFSYCNSMWLQLLPVSW